MSGFDETTYPPTIVKDPGAELEYGEDWSGWLAPSGDSLATSAWTVPAGLTKMSEGRDGAVPWVKLSGGALGASYTVACAITTAGGKKDGRSFVVQVCSR